MCGLTRCCSEGMTPLVILDRGAVDHAESIDDVLPVTLEYGNQDLVLRSCSSCSSRLHRVLEADGCFPKTN